MPSLDFPCDWRAGFIMDPNKKQRVGYLVQFQGLDMGEFFKQDVEVFTPYNNSTANYGGITLQKDTGKATVVGVIDSFSWGGGVGDPICISAYISSENANSLSAKLKSTLSTTTVKSLAWWICNFDSETKVWFEEAYPLSSPSIIAQLNGTGSNIRLQVASEATKIASNVDVNVYNIYFEVVPAANSTYDFHFATDSKNKVAKNWGLKVGTNAEAAVAAA